MYTLADMRSQDAILANYLESIRSSAAQSTSEEFREIYGEQTFVFESTSVTGTIELCSEGRTVILTKENSEKYIRSYLKAYTE